jgi:tungstate transport system ATP-binding protein
MIPSVYTLCDVKQTYGPRTVLNVPSLAIETGEVLTIVGPSGAGKSTLLRLLALLQPPTSGSVSLRLDGQAITYASVSTADRRQMAMVFQRPVLLSRSAYENVAYGLRLRGERDAEERIRQALDQVAMIELAGAHVRTLSGGEAQRIALARALVVQPRILLLDEPTANLDMGTARLIEDLIAAQHNAGTTVILVTHNIFQARRLATRVALFIEGDLVEAAPVHAFFESPDDPRTAAFVGGDLNY